MSPEMALTYDLDRMEGSYEGWEHDRDLLKQRYGDEAGALFDRSCRRYANTPEGRKALQIGEPHLGALVMFVLLAVPPPADL